MDSITFLHMVIYVCVRQHRAEALAGLDCFLHVQEDVKLYCVGRS